MNTVKHSAFVSAHHLLLFFGGGAELLLLSESRTYNPPAFHSALEEESRLLLCDIGFAGNRPAVRQMFTG